jgi:putative component of membrane protein insertase Oxa1/YidC/SpoIIIJ protein YidD
MSQRPESSHVHIEEPRLRDMPVTLFNLPRMILLASIRLYQMTLSYSYQAIYKYGAVKGSLMATWRILRCNPFNPGGFDPVK